MPLTLRVTSIQKGALGNAATKVFAEQGGTIGRVKDNDWVLPDPERIISSRHAVIHYQGGSYYLTDTSANGTYLNGAEEPVGNGNRVEINDGDRIVIGDYEVAVEVRAAGGLEIPEPGMVGAGDHFDPGMGAASQPGVGEAGGEPLDPLELLSGTGGTPASQVHDPWGAASPVTDTGASLPDDLPSASSAFQPPGAYAERIPEDWDLSDEDLLPSTPTPPPSPPVSAPPPPPSPAPVAPPRRAEPPPAEKPVRARPAVSPQAPAKAAAPAAEAPPRAPVDGSAALAAFLHGAGLDTTAVPPERAEQFMHLIGEIFRECMQDLRDVLMARASLKSGFRMELTMIRAAENNPLKFAAGGVDEALENLLFKDGSSYLPPLRAVSEGFQDIKDHQLAMMAGMQAAFRTLLERFDPVILEKKFEKSGGWSLLGVQKKADHWERFSVLYNDVKEQAEEDFQNLFGTEFSRAYEAQIRALGKARKKAQDTS